MGHTFTNILIHAVFSTKGRRSSIPSPVLNELFAYMAGIASNEGCLPLAVNGTRNHAHLLLRIRPAHCLSDLIRKIKANSSKWLRASFLDTKSFRWQTGFSAFSINESSVSNVRHYIDHQYSHHNKLSFEEELQKELTRNSIEFNKENLL